MSSDDFHHVVWGDDDSYRLCQQGWVSSSFIDQTEVRENTSGWRWFHWREREHFKYCPVCEALEDEVDSVDTALSKRRFLVRRALGEDGF